MEIDPSEFVVILAGLSSALDVAINALMRLNVQVEQIRHQMQETAPEPHEEAQGLGSTPWSFAAPGTS